MSDWRFDIHQGYLEIQKSIVVGLATGATPDDLEPYYEKRKQYIERYRELIGRNLSAMRNTLGISLRDFAAESSISAATILRYEKGSVLPKYETLDKLISVLKELGLEAMFSDLFIDDYASPEQFDVKIYPGERVVLGSMSKLNDKGQRIAGERIEELTKIPEYQNGKDLSD